MSPRWTPSSWQNCVAAQQPKWPDQNDLEQALKQIGSYPPLVFAGEARSLLAALGQVASGNAFLLQAGDCAESFEEFTAVNIREITGFVLAHRAENTWPGGIHIELTGDN
ncbi:MAG: 3-deoxy-7-phosphoheptulonate synthase class II, partial [Actinobacteria bacterium]|nr:3-deoxy-7-phosphoheptulonate synthase class II [Actinomycetota bacterium]